jgi:hypothetical protein
MRGAGRHSQHLGCNMLLAAINCAEMSVKLRLGTACRGWLLHGLLL